MTVDIVAVPFDGYGRPGHQARAAEAYLEAGLAAHASLPLRVGGALELPPGVGERGPRTGLLNEAALGAAIDLVGARVARSVRGGGFPLVVGGDCSLLLGTFAGAREAAAGLGLLFLDGHEDTTPLDVVEDGEAANTELGVLLGVTGRAPDFPWPHVHGILAPGRLAVLGPRDDEMRRALNVGSVAALGAHVRSAAQCRAAPRAAGRGAVAFLGDGPWWLHVDLDVVDPAELPATLVPGEEEHEPGGLAWSELTELAVAAVRKGGCAGLSVAVFDPDQDPTGAHALRIVRFVHEVVGAAVRPS